MGIFEDSTETDIQAITWVAGFSIKAWNDYILQKGGEATPYHVELNDTLVRPLSELGGKILKEHFRNPDYLDRISALLVLANCLQFFRLSKAGRPVTTVHERREFFSRLTCAFVTASLRLFKPPGGRGSYCFHFFSEEIKRDRFFAFLQRLDPAEVGGGGKQTK